VLLGVLLGLQLMLGVETWFSKFSQGVAPEMQQPVTTVMQATTRTAHVLVGALLLATTTALAVRVTLTAWESAKPAALPVRTSGASGCNGKSIGTS